MGVAYLNPARFLSEYVHMHYAYHMAGNVIFFLKLHSSKWITSDNTLHNWSNFDFVSPYKKLSYMSRVSILPFWHSLPPFKVVFCHSQETILLLGCFVGMAIPQDIWLFCPRRYDSHFCTHICYYSKLAYMIWVPNVRGVGSTTYSKMYGINYRRLHCCLGSSFYT